MCAFKPSSSVAAFDIFQLYANLFDLFVRSCAIQPVMLFASVEMSLKKVF